MTERILIARIGAPHGVRGEVRLFIFAQDPEAVLDYAPLTDADGRRVFRIVALRPAKEHFVARLAGVEDRNAAEALTNVDLYVPRDALPEAEDEDTFYHADLIGLRVEDEAGATLGTVTALHDFGAGDVLEYMPIRAEQPDTDSASQDPAAQGPAGKEQAGKEQAGKGPKGKGAAVKARGSSLMVPFSRLAVPVVDVAGGRVVLAAAFIETGEESPAPGEDTGD